MEGISQQKDLPTSGRRTGIMYQNEERDIVLMDIPTSIAAAQGASHYDTLLSTEPLKEPFVITHEPKTKKKQDKQAASASNPLHAEYKMTIEMALAQIQAHVAGPWCLPRKLMTQVPQRRNASITTDTETNDPEKDLEARLREWSTSKEGNTMFSFEQMMASLSATSEPNATLTETVAYPWLMSYRSAREMMAVAQGDENVLAVEPWTSSFYNADDDALELTIFANPAKPGNGTQEYYFTIPPKSGLFLSDSTHPDMFRTSFRQLTEEYALPRHFDFILLDPPWPNGSVKRKGAYEQVGGMLHMKKTLKRMDIDNYIEHNGLVGIWITNKESLREHILGPGGLFEQWNVGFIEEWIWIKTTVHGEPMLSIDSSWRKPYETLLLGRAAPNSWTVMSPAPEIKKRVIAAVPDIHSRKPCLKELIIPYMPDPEDYTALEIFSRYLVAGWMSWGNEVLKFNWGQYWASSEGNAEIGGM